MSDELREGRELDVAMHTALFGTVHRVPEGKIIYTADRDYVWGGGFYCYDEDGQPWELPYYSTDIAAAWEVVERMRERGFFPEIFAAIKGEWGVQFKTWSEDEGGCVGCEFVAPTAPLAICKAALSALRAPGGGS